MSSRLAFVRFLSLFVASLQLAMPGLSAIADGALARESAANPATHVEASTRASCPVVHSPDCAVCRYLSVSAFSSSGHATVAWAGTSQCRVIPALATRAAKTDTVFPPGRAPPVL